MNVLTNRFGTTAFKRALLLGIVAAFLMSFTVAQTLTATSKSSTVKLGGESFTSDADVSLVWNGLSKASTNQTTLGDTGPGIEATTGLAAVRTAITKNNYVYAFEVKEAAVTSWPAARQYKVEVYGDDGTTVTLLATLYLQNGTADAAGVEGGSFRIDTGSTSVVHDSYSLVITKVQ